MTAAPWPGDHRWSGWPGAWCFDCGAEDLTEVCLSGAECKTDVGQAPCAKHQNPPCPEPGSNRHNPYTNGAAAIVSRSQARRLAIQRRRR